MLKIKSLKEKGIKELRVQDMARIIYLDSEITKYCDVNDVGGSDK